MKRLKVIIISILVIIFIPLSSYPFFKYDDTFSARASGMGGAFAAIADDVSAAVYNIAGISELRNKEILFSYSKEFTGMEKVNLNYSYLSFLYPLTFSSISLYYNNFNVSDLYREYIISIGYGINLMRLTSYKVIKLLSGINLKYLSNYFILDERSSNDPFFQLNNNNFKAFSMDIGFILKNFIKNLSPFSLSLFLKDFYKFYSNFPSDNIPVEVRCGASYYFFLDLFRKNKLKFDVDMIYRNNDINLAGGAELSILNNLILFRGGLDFYKVTTGIGINYQLNNGFEVNLDYAFLYPYSIIGTLGSHIVSFHFLF